MSLFRTLLVLLVCFGATRLLHAAMPEKDLPPTYRHWLTEEVSYIIESQERNEFLTLRSDAERDNFIRQFWAARNPAPGSEANSYKEEHYRRLAYANEQFGNAAAQNGWRTDQGRIYITLGEPKQKVTYPNNRNTRPMIAWFYQAQSPALPPYFYILFYKRSFGDPYTIYSPYQDGPNRLVTGQETLNEQSRSLQMLRASLGDEIARLAVSLIPSEPVDLKNPSPTMVSDTMLSTISGLADNPLEQERIRHNRSREKITASILNPNDAPDVSYTVIRNARGRTIVNYLIQLQAPDPTLIGPRKDKSVGYDITVQNRIRTAAGTPVYDTVTVLSGSTSSAQADSGRTKAFAAEERFALVPGTYIVESTLTNNHNLQAHRTSKEVVVPEPKRSVLGMSEPLAYRGNPTRDPDDVLPFSYSSLRFSPVGIRSVTIHSGDPISCVFQLWLPKRDGVVRNTPVRIHYLYGAVVGGKVLSETDENMDVNNADAAGNMVTGHRFPTYDLEPGNYRVVIRATQEGSPPVFATMTMRVVAAEVAVGTWSAYGPPEPSQEEHKRELSAKAFEKH